MHERISESTQTLGVLLNSTYHSVSHIKKEKEKEKRSKNCAIGKIPINKHKKCFKPSLSKIMLEPQSQILW